MYNPCGVSGDANLENMKSWIDLLLQYIRCNLLFSSNLQITNFWLILKLNPLIALKNITLLNILYLQQHKFLHSGIIS